MYEVVSPLMCCFAPSIPEMSSIVAIACLTPCYVNDNEPESFLRAETNSIIVTSTKRPGPQLEVDLSAEISPYSRCSLAQNLHPLHKDTPSSFIVVFDLVFPEFCYVSKTSPPCNNPSPQAPTYNYHSIDITGTTLVRD